MRTIAHLFAIVACIVGAAGIALSSEATFGVTIVAFGCLLAIVARMAQASAHHREAHSRARLDPQPSPAAPVASDWAEMKNPLIAFAALVAGLLVWTLYFNF